MKRISWLGVKDENKSILSGFFNLPALPGRDTYYKVKPEASPAAAQRGEQGAVAEQKPSAALPQRLKPNAS